MYHRDVKNLIWSLHSITQIDKYNSHQPSLTLSLVLVSNANIFVCERENLELAESSASTFIWIA